LRRPHRTLDNRERPPRSGCRHVESSPLEPITAEITRALRFASGGSSQLWLVGHLTHNPGVRLASVPARSRVLYPEARSIVGRDEVGSRQEQRDATRGNRPLDRIEARRDDWPSRPLNDPHPGFTALTCFSPIFTWIAGPASLRTIASDLSDERFRRWAASIRRRWNSACSASASRVARPTDRHTISPGQHRLAAPARADALLGGPAVRRGAGQRVSAHSLHRPRASPPRGSTSSGWSIRG
jgi:hypothetical protein